MSSQFVSIRCFQHLQHEPHVSCFEIPAFCPVCKQDLKNASFSVPPFCLPNPLCYSSDRYQQERHPYKVLIKPTNGDFLCEYNAGDNLHIGLTDSKGKIYSFDEQGLTIESTCWNNCLYLNIMELMNAEVTATWDGILMEHAQSKSWYSEKFLSLNLLLSPNSYNETSNNCFTFVLSFLNNFLDQKPTKKEFSDKYILPITRRAASYIAVYRKISSNGVFIHQ